MRHLYAAALALTLAACGASAGPAPAGDAGPADTQGDAFPCGAREAFVGGQCVPASDSACGADRRACVAPQRCVLDDAPDGAFVVHCATL